jgi:hypothetical protein
MNSTKLALTKVRREAPDKKILHSRFRILMNSSLENITNKLGVQQLYVCGLASTESTAHTAFRGNTPTQSRFTGTEEEGACVFLFLVLEKKGTPRKRKKQIWI